MTDHNIPVFENLTCEYDLWFETHIYTYESEVLTVRSLLPRSGKGLEVGVGLTIHPFSNKRQKLEGRYRLGSVSKINLHELTVKRHQSEY